MSKRIMKVEEVDLTLEKSNPPCLVIEAKGIVGTLGWTNGRLDPWYYIDFPEDGIQDFDFIADPPEDMTPQVNTEISASPKRWDDPPMDLLKGVRIHTKNNELVELLAD